MSTTVEPPQDIDTPSLRIGRSVAELFDTRGNARAEALAAANAPSHDTAFTPPRPLDWLHSPDSDDDAQPRWTERTAEACRTGILRTYRSDHVTGAPAGSDELTGLRFTHKDNIGLTGFPLTAGNPSLSDRRASVTSPLLTAIESADGRFIGANHMAEFAMSPTGHNHWLGDGVNPRNAAYLSGGSSSGSAVAVASGACEVSLGTDTGGSVRLPAAFCGLAGYKPSNGLFSSAGLIPLSETLDTIGVLAHDAGTVRRVADVLFADDAVVTPADRSRLDSSDDCMDTTGPETFTHLSLAAAERTCDPDIAAAYTATLAGIGIDTIASGERGVDCDDTELNRLSVVVVSVEAARNVGRVLDWDWDLLGDQVLSRVIRGTTISAIEYADAIVDRDRLREQYLAATLGSARFLLTPTSPIPAPTAPSGSTEADARLRREYMRASLFTRAINYLGLPAITIPLAPVASGISPGLQIIGRPFDDRALLDCAVAVTNSLNTDGSR